MLEKLRAALDVAASFSWLIGFAPLPAARRDVVVWKPKTLTEVETHVAELVMLVHAARAETEAARSWAAYWRRLAEDELQRDQWRADQHQSQLALALAQAQYNNQAQIMGQMMAQGGLYQQGLGLQNAGPFHSCTPSRSDAITGRLLESP